MTTDEIKQSVKMADLIADYGIKIDKKGFCRCPFHNEKTASMKIYKDSFHCFGCGANGDVFTFVQSIDNCDFKTAFLKLGGTYQHDKTSGKLALYHAQREKEKRQRLEAQQQARQSAINRDIHESRELMNKAIPNSDDFWENAEKFYNSITTDENMRGGE